MKSGIWLLVLLALVNRIKARSKVSLTDLITCQEYSIKSGTGYGYHDYFDVNKLNGANASERDELLRLEFFVQAAKDAHIILAESITPQRTDKVSEIAIGQSSIYHNGTVTARNPDVQIDSLCPDSEKDWPHKSILCPIEIRLANWDASLVYGRQSKVEQDFVVKLISVKVPKKE